MELEKEDYFKLLALVNGSREQSLKNPAILEAVTGGNLTDVEYENMNSVAA